MISTPLVYNCITFLFLFFQSTWKYEAETGRSEHLMCVVRLLKWYTKELLFHIRNSVVLVIFTELRAFTNTPTRWHMNYCTWMRQKGVPCLNTPLRWFTLSPRCTSTLTDTRSITFYCINNWSHSLNLIFMIHIRNHSTGLIYFYCHGITKIHLWL